MGKTGKSKGRGEAGCHEIQQKTQVSGVIKRYYHQFACVSVSGKTSIYPHYCAFFSYSRSTLIGGRGLQEGEGDEEGGSLDRELRARGQRQPDLLDVGRDDDDDAASGDGDCDHLCEICRVHGHDPGEAGRPGEGQPDA